MYASDMGGVLWNGDCSTKSKIASRAREVKLRDPPELHRFTTTSALLLNGCPWEI
jgi:hypothetical protein